MWANLQKLADRLRKESWAKGLPLDESFWRTLMGWMEQHLLYEFLSHVIQQVDDIVEIDPDLSERRILELATQYMVDFLSARSASVRIYDPQTGQMLSYGSHPSEEKERETYIPLSGSIAGDVVKTRKPCVVPNILKDARYRNKEAALRKEVRSLLAVPLEIPRFYPRERDTVGVIQIYYREEDREFTPLEIQLATLMAKRLSFVIARKKILSMNRVNEKKEAILTHIFRRLGTRGGIKMKDVFNQIIPELADVVNLQSCALFSVTRDYEKVVLEAGYPETEGYHSIGKTFPVNSEPAFEVLLNLRDYSGDSPYEIVTLSYILVVDPQKSLLLSDNLKRFAADHNINSILYIPLNVNGEVSHFMTFDAIDHRKRYKEDEIEIFLFLGRELMKAQKMERLDDILHDFKNPAIATAGFARRMKRLLEMESTDGSKERLSEYADILFEETTRLQELAMSLYEVGEQQVVDLTDVLRRRFQINREAIKELMKQNVTLTEGPFQKGLFVRCYPLHLERVLDNLLNNATKAIPMRGGILGIRTYGERNWACAEITNTGYIPEEDRVGLLEGEGSGRGLYITHRIIRLLDGKIEIRGGEDSTTFVVRLPISKPALDPKSKA